MMHVRLTDRLHERYDERYDEHKYYTYYFYCFCPLWRSIMERVWIIYESIKIGIIGLSLIIFGISCQWYRYHECDEVVNVQGMIEEIYEREFLQHENEEDSSDDQDTILIKSLMNYQTFH